MALIGEVKSILLSITSNIQFRFKAHRRWRGLAACNGRVALGVYPLKREIRILGQKALFATQHDCGVASGTRLLNFAKFPSFTKVTLTDRRNASRGYDGERMTAVP